MAETVGKFLMSSKGINNVVLTDGQGKVICNSYDSYNSFSDYYDTPVKSCMIDDRANLGYVATLVI